MANHPYFRFFPADAEGDEFYRRLNLEERGLFHSCLNFSWLNHGLPLDLEGLAHDFRVPWKQFQRAWKRVSAGWKQDGGRLFNSRQEKERQYVLAKSQSASIGARGASEEAGYIYFVKRNDGAVKIGSTRDVPRRVAQLRYRYRDPALTLLGKHAVDNMRRAELDLHQTFDSKRLHGEWFRLSADDLNRVIWEGDTQGDSEYHPYLRASDSDYDYDSGNSEQQKNLRAVSERKLAAADLNGATSQRFEDWWLLWSKVRGTFKKHSACQAYISVVTTALEAACFDCTRSYLASLKDRSNGYNPDNFLFEQAKDDFAGRWIPRKKTVAEVLAEDEAESERIDRERVNGGQ